jgi:hypothetical protein
MLAFSISDARDSKLSFPYVAYVVWQAAVIFFYALGSKKNQAQIFHRSSRRKSGAPVTFAEIGIDENEAIHFRALSFSTFELHTNHLFTAAARTFDKNSKIAPHPSIFKKNRAPDAPPPHSLSINEARFHRFRPLTRRAVIRLLVFLFEMTSNPWDSPLG